MRNSLLMSAAVLGLAFAAPAFAQSTIAPATMAPATMAPAPGTPGDTAATTAPAPVTHHWRHARRHHVAGDPGQMAQSGADASNGMVRPGHVPGVGDSQPASNQASNINGGDTRSVIAPRLPAPADQNATPEQLLREARVALHRGQTGAAQEALERAETRVLDRSTAPENVSQPDQGAFIRAISEARRDLSNHDMAGTQSAISAAMSSRFAQGAMPGRNQMGQNGMGAVSSAPMVSSPPMAGGMPMGTMPMQQGNSAYTPPGGPNALATMGATNGNAIGASTGGPANANGIPGTPNGISSQTGSNSGGSGGSSGR